MTADASGRASLGVLVAALTLAMGCGEPRGAGQGEPCQVCLAVPACLQAFYLLVTDEAHEAVPSPSATSPGLTCAAIPNNPGQVQCLAGTEAAALAPVPTGTYAVEVTAPGFVAKPVQVVVGPQPIPDACGCGRCQTWTPDVVTLARAP